MLHHLISQCLTMCSRNKLSILIYHQVLDELDDMRPGEPDKTQFDWQMQLLHKYFNPMPLSEALMLLRENTLPPRSVCVTFDDGYLNNLQVAYPILKRYQIPATVFVASEFSQGINMWNDRVLDLFKYLPANNINLSAVGEGMEPIDDLKKRRHLAAKTLMKLKYLPVQERLERIEKLYNNNGSITEQRRMMTPEEIKQLSDYGIEIGAHTHNHPILKELTLEQLNMEITQNRELLQQWTGKPVQGFAYPNGKPEVDFDEETVSRVKALNFDYAVSTQWGVARPDSDMFTLCRFTPWDRTPYKFHLRLLKNLIQN
ncbi:polysaccharide deacetylase family protein [Aestuariicella hydrocarbonica]|uniref:Polysaccharide deacetylase family protein n=1 Tax=Pseudomaricurvus hydrocarbonicus TaxID=1470433 RepID=A0A9E5JU96_9GAMM|nr:polysaccharide deacetylase family protein [Aestuariicella hydrocarbonica]NHO64680.1 polysaccharide deacetylase family protein [Aestuariicella hydrocarbonica]